MWGPALVYAIAVVTKYFDVFTLRNVESFLRLRRYFPAPGENSRFHPSCLGLFDLIVPNVKQRKTRPGQLIIRMQLDGFLSRFDGGSKISVLHERHTQRVPTIKEFGLDLHALSIFFDSAR